MLSYSTLLGGNSLDVAYAVSPYPGGGTVVAGYTTSANFPMINPLAGAVPAGFITRFDASGSGVSFSSGLPTGVYLFGTVVDPAGNIYVVGSTSNSGLPLVNPIQATPGGGFDAYVVEISPAGAILFSTYFGGPSNEDCYAMAVDSAGFIYIAGLTDGPGLPTHIATQATYAGSNDQFAVKLDPSTHSVVFATYLGGPSDDRATAVALDGQGGMYVGGSSYGTGFPIKNAAYPTALGNYEGTLTRLGSDGGIVFSTFVGGSGFDLLNALAVRPDGGVVAVGDTDSPDMVTVGAVQSMSGGGHDAFVLGMTPSGAVLFQTFFGGAGDDTAYGVAVSPDGTIAFTGTTVSADFPRVAALQQALHTDGGPANAFVAVLSRDGTAITFSTVLGGGGAFIGNPFASYVGDGESANAVAFDPSGALLVAGETFSADFPTLGAWQSRLDGGDDAFLLKISFYVDAGTPDAGAPDGGGPDAGVTDSGVTDSGVTDGGATDAGGVMDAGALDAGRTLDGGESDAGGTLDGGATDAGELSPDGGRAGGPYAVGCACDAGGLPTGVLILLIAARKRRSRSRRMDVGPVDRWTLCKRV